ncbi:defender against cell death 1 [Phakopsora pachyrhizi]|uniref:Dolichyl-diphosphooligosaccharide--protein glycosyltransferase subunit OST2 n=1 Tax=Phakopsora pachyrhizi TaxID=170000 RepID=A0AAV0AIW6_PHAPC|nr:defender against cell death 1 [Phakopsora pachyrhizi]KAI8450475.1 defender against cell death 1 [Phakopsora pachyrhizi]CAH7668404.1 defender against cell death 1 [Phakopsora pachyrhizi]
MATKPNGGTHQSASAGTAVRQLFDSYLGGTPSSLLLIDSFLVFLMFSGVIQFVYCTLFTNFPFNAFLASFSAHIGQFVLTASLRSQVNPQNSDIFESVSPERAFADFVFGSLVLHFFAFNFLG